MRGLYAIVDLGTLEANHIQPLEFASAILSVRPCALQLRAKEVPAREMLGLLRALVPLCRAARVPLVCNDRADLAMLAGCDMVHLGQDDAPVELVRRLSPGLGVGISTHNLDQLARALDLRPDYVAFGPVFRTMTKANPSPVVGTQLLREASALARSRGIPLVAIGGISLDTAAEVATLADAAALISGLVVERAAWRSNALWLNAALGGREALLASAPA